MSPHMVKLWVALATHFSDPVDTRTCYSLPLLLHDQPVYWKKDIQMRPGKVVVEVL